MRFEGFKVFVSSWPVAFVSAVKAVKAVADGVFE